MRALRIACMHKAGQPQYPARALLCRLRSMYPPLRIHPLLWAMPVAAVLAIYSALAEQRLAFMLLKPLPLLLLIACVWLQAPLHSTKLASRLLLAGLVLSVMGDICLLWPSGFLPGLVSFLSAHVAYVLLFRRDRPWHQPAWTIAALGTALVAGALYLYLFRNGLSQTMRIPVAAYVLVIGAMAAQAMARAATLRTRPALWVALGAVSFMASDTLLALNKFVAPLPASPLLVLGTYYLAQWLIVAGMLPALHRHASRQEAACTL